MSTQTLKSVSSSRVNVGASNNLASSRFSGHSSAFCIASAPDLQNDVYGRNVGSLGVDMRGAPECNAYMPHGQSATDHIMRENLERPYLPIAPEGARGGGDLMGKGRDMIPQDLYGMGIRGNFVRHSQPGLTLPQTHYDIDDIPPTIQRMHYNLYTPSSQNTTSDYYYRG